MRRAIIAVKRLGHLEEVNQRLRGEEWLVRCTLFAPYAPEQKPVENIGLQGKQFVGWFYQTCQSFKQVKALFEWFIDHQIFDLPKLYTYWNLS